MRANSKAAVTLLESGEVLRWFASNNWNYPCAGAADQGPGRRAAVLRGDGAVETAGIASIAVEFRFAVTVPIRFAFR